MLRKERFPKFALVVALFATPFFTSCSATDEAIAPKSADSSTEASAPAQRFFVSLMNSGGEFGGKVAIPAIWIFSADGKMDRLVASEEELAALAQASGSVNTPSPGLTCEQVDAAFKEAAPNQSWRFECGDGQPSALLITNREVCKTCDAFEAKFAELTDIAPERRQTLVLTQ